MGNCCSGFDNNGIRLGSTDDLPNHPNQPQMEVSLAERQRALDAAEERRQAQMGKGKLARKLQEQNAIGPGRAVDTSLPTSSSGGTGMTWKADA